MSKKETYKKKYTTKDRLDMSKGGRVGYQRRSRRPGGEAPTGKKQRRGEVLIMEVLKSQLKVKSLHQ